MFSSLFNNLGLGGNGQGSVGFQGLGNQPAQQNPWGIMSAAMGLMGQGGLSSTPQQLNPMAIMEAINKMNYQQPSGVNPEQPQMGVAQAQPMGAQQQPGSNLQPSPQMLQATPDQNIPNAMAPNQANSERGPDISALTQYAQATYPGNPVMQQVALSQAILESGAPGKMSTLSSQNNNLFGIKSSQTAPGTAANAMMPTREYVNGVPQTSTQPFSSNNSIMDSFAQHRDLLNKLNRYQPVVNAASPQQAFSALQRSGYASDPNYANKLNNVFSTYVRPLYQNY